MANLFRCSGGRSEAAYQNALDQMVEETASGAIASFSDGANNIQIPEITVNIDSSASECNISNGTTPPTIDTAPYLFRQSGGDNNAYVGTEETDKLVGASAVVNQLVDKSKFINVTHSDYTVVNNKDGSLTVTIINTLSSNVKVLLTSNTTSSYVKLPKNHRYILFDNNILPNGVVYRNGYNGQSIGVNVIKSQTATIDYFLMSLFLPSGLTAQTFTIKPNITDLTAMFGTAIADYVYSLEQATAGSGIAYLRKYGFFTKDYYPYTANTLQSVNTSKHVMRDGSDVIIGEYALPNIDLRGLYKLDASNNLYADGDTLEGDGTLTRKYEQRPYQSGDESLADAITDGTNTVVKLATPTTEQATGFTNPQTVSKYGTEEYTDERDFPLPVGHSTLYHPATRTTYNIPFGQSASGELHIVEGQNDSIVSSGTTITLSSKTVIPTRLGENNIWADTGDVDVTYRANGALYVQEHPITRGLMAARPTEQIQEQEEQQEEKEINKSEDNER